MGTTKDTDAQANKLGRNQKSPVKGKKRISVKPPRLQRPFREKEADDKWFQKEAVINLLRRKSLKTKYKKFKKSSRAINKETRRAKRRLFEKTWLNSNWRKKWRARYGKDRWKQHLKNKWNLHKEWRLKWMIRLRENWWNIKWRRKWIEQFLVEEWRKKIDKARRKRRRFWMEKWRKGGFKRMGLTFNEFLLTQRRLKTLKHVPRDIVNRRRKEKRLFKEGRLEGIHIETDLKKSMNKALIQRFKDLKEKYKSHKHVEFKPGIIQFKFYTLNACQGFLTLLSVFFFCFDHAFYIPPEFGTPGLLVLLLIPGSLDFFGSIFGMITSSFLHVLYQQTKGSGRQKQSESGCFTCCKSEFKKNKVSNDKQDSNVKKNHRLGTPNSRKSSSSRRSLSSVNEFGCLSYTFLHLAWLCNIIFTGYYSLIEHHSGSKEYQDSIEKCKILPIEQHCYEFELLYSSAAAIVVTSFILRSIFVFIIGMCISERYLKRSHSGDPREEIPSTCSDTDVDYGKVPKQILIPYLLSDGSTYPYDLPESTRSFEELRRRRHLYRTANLDPDNARKQGRNRKRIQSALDKDANKVLNSFRNVRRTAIPLPKGRRRPFKLPPATDVPDTIQFTPDLMTMEARAWLSEDDSESSADDFPNTTRKPKRRARKIKPVREANSLVVIHRKESQPNLRADVTTAIKPKVENLNDRLSTDESWDDHASFLFDPRSDQELEEEDSALAKKKSEEQYLSLMAYNEDDFGDGPDFHHF